jgi:DNA-binding transcriptional MerR regulator
MYYTPEQTAAMLKIAKSTLRKYSAIFSGHLSQAANRTHRKYTEDDIAILRRIVELREQNVPLNEISDRLGVVPKSRPDSTLAMIPQISQEFESLHSQLARLREDQSAEMKAIQDRLDQLESIVTTQRRSFWDRLFKR